MLTVPFFKGNCYISQFGMFLLHRGSASATFDFPSTIDEPKWHTGTVEQFNMPGMHCGNAAQPKIRCAFSVR